ncbi:aminotransferase class V-fold PLP-dependent enzyme [Polyangium sp. 6x1]|uniref:aminotransferase class V-fold PLP-dependent enzyme n=1 Tax=Polyangium sp. 6x1 TaxID=3042689 RepID=UPI0024822A76|nr:aminotransferase class V-fold PLP-dependent enzyme [Polyangium sp. 6x1]MDI1443921.1 aminotransferase class V-fold PLP-dependent enzyme [Polyangium sp. 6x1]
MFESGHASPPSASVDPRCLTEFDGYRLLERLGEGAMGEVWRALDLTLDRHVAIKMIRGAHPSERDRERFRLEALALGRIEHPNVVAVYRSGEALGQPYIVYELVAGKSLDTLVGVIEWQEVLALGVDVARGLAAVHHASVLHRDLKPANVMRTRVGAGKLIDFGVAKLPSRPALEEASPESIARFVANAGLPSGDVTRKGDILGTPRYLAPELWRAAPASVASDIYALGLILWELLAGAPPYGPKRPLMQLVEAILKEPLPSIASLRPDIPFELAATVDRAVQKDPAKRFASADALVAALEGVVATMRALGLLPEAAASPSERQAELVRMMFRRALSRSSFPERFYERLFERHPDMRPLFPLDLSGQGRKLVTALTASVACLRDTHGLHAMLEELGARHVLYGVREAHIDSFGEALRAELDLSEGGRMDDELAEAWSEAWEQLAGAVRRGIRLAALPEAEAEPIASGVTSRKTQGPDAIAALLGTTTLFADLDGDERREIAARMRPFRVEAGEVLCAQGAPADELYVVADGLLAVSIRTPADDRIFVGESGPGGVLGELALNQRLARAATVTAVRRASGHTLEIADFERLRHARHPAALKVLRRLSKNLCHELRCLTREMTGLAETVAGGSGDRPADELGEARPLSPDIEPLLCVLPFFASFSARQLEDVASVLVEREVPQGRTILAEGASSGSAFLLARGAVEITVRAGARRTHLAVLGPGRTLGMEALLDGSLQRVTCVARENVVLLEIAPETLERLITSDLAMAFQIVEAVNRDLIDALQQTDARIVRRATQALVVGADDERTMTTKTLTRMAMASTTRGLVGGAENLVEQSMSGFVEGLVTVLDVPPAPRDAADEARAPAAPREAPSDKEALFAKVRASVLGDDVVLVGPFGPRRVVHADPAASGRSVGFLEAFLRSEVMPLYANTLAASPGAGAPTSPLREDAREIIHRSVGGGSDDIVLFCGSGATSAIETLVRALGLLLPRELDARYHVRDRIPEHERPVVFLGAYEPPSNELPWRESIADVVTIDVDAEGRIDLRQLEAALETYAHRPLKMGSFSAASRVTGILADDVAISTLLHRHGALSFWDYAEAGPSLDIRMNPEGPGVEGPLAHKDAVFLAPHRFIGGPGAPGVLVAKRSLFHDETSAREEAAAPAILESIRAGLVFQLKAAIGTAAIRARENDFVKRAIASFRTNDKLQVLGPPELERGSIVSLVVRHGLDRFLHFRFVVALLNDLFGIQARGEGASLGPHGGSILGIAPEPPVAFAEAVEAGCGVLRPGWVRVHFDGFMTETVFLYIVAAIHLIANDGWKLLPMYRCDAETGQWTHVAGRPRPALRLNDLTYRGGELEYRSMRTSEPETALAAYLDEARSIFASAPVEGPPDPRCELDIPEAFRHLRWFPTPLECFRAHRAYDF